MLWEVHHHIISGTVPFRPNFYLNRFILLRGLQRDTCKVVAVSLSLSRGQCFTLKKESSSQPCVNVYLLINWHWNISFLWYIRGFWYKKDYSPIVWKKVPVSFKALQQNSCLRLRETLFAPLLTCTDKLNQLYWQLKFPPTPYNRSDSKHKEQTGSCHPSSQVSTAAALFPVFSLLLFLHCNVRRWWTLLR